MTFSIHRFTTQDMQLSSILSWWALDSRGNPTVAVAITDTHGNIARAYVPSGASTGSHEALELRDGGNAFGGKGVDKAADNVRTSIASALTGKELTYFELENILLALDRSPNKSQLGANAVLGVSMALQRLEAMEHKHILAQCIQECWFANKQMSFPRLMVNIVNGGAHSDAGLAIQEFMIVPHTNSLPNDIQAASEIYHCLKKILSKKGMVTAVGDEGGFAPHIATTREVLDTIVNAVQVAGYENRCDLALDCAASEFYDDKIHKYTIDGQALTKEELVSFYQELCTLYPIISIEDGCHEDDIAGWKLLTEVLGEQIKLVGDDLFVTNTDRIQKIGIDQNIGNSLLVKLNQIGSVSETVAAINLAQNHGMTTIISHRSGETEDSFIADLAVASGSEFIKLGAPARTDRTVKYNRLLELYHTLTTTQK